MKDIGIYKDEKMLVRYLYDALTFYMAATNDHEFVKKWLSKEILQFA